MNRTDTLLSAIYDKLEEIKLTLSPPVRRKLIPGEDVVVDDCTFKEVQGAAARVIETLGQEYLHIILQRIPTAGLATLKSNEWSRFIRLCQYYLNEPKS